MPNSFTSSTFHIQFTISVTRFGEKFAAILLKCFWQTFEWLFRPIWQILSLHWQNFIVANSPIIGKIIYPSSHAVDDHYRDRRRLTCLSKTWAEHQSKVEFTQKMRRRRSRRRRRRRQQCDKMPQQKVAQFFKKLAKK